MVAPAFATTEARQAFRRRLPWIELTEMAGSPEKRTEAASEQNSEMAHSISVTSEAASSVPPLGKIQKTVLGDILSKSTTSKILREHPETCSKQVISKL
uniref:Uncharacterized protein n=1 Tax=Oryza brachyantha TaxID=4533 RepID=J3LIJ1_ORYBR